MKPLKLGFAGKLGQTFIHSKLTPVIAIASILLGLMAVYLTPKEEELLELYLPRIWAIIERLAEEMLASEGKDFEQLAAEEIKALLPSAIQLYKGIHNGF
jgi:hypothetical protein